MKKRFLLLTLAMFIVLSTFPAASAAPGDAINFPDPNFEAAVRESIGKPAGSITRSDVEGKTTLSIKDRSVSNLSGIEHFTSLKVLNCDNNNLTALDMSKNTELTTLYCGSNSLNSLDVSKNTALTSLWCGENKLASLDVSKNAKLEYLLCYDNQLSSLDVSKNTELASLSCSNNGLTSLDVSKNTKLVWLNSSGNLLTTLDVGKNTELTSFTCPGNKLTSLDVSKNTKLEWLTCSDNQLTTLDVSNCTSLLYLYCELNNMASEDAVIGLSGTKVDKLGKSEEGQSYFVFHPQRAALSAPSLRTASAWAQYEIASAVGKGIVPVDLQDDYKNVITRQEFCRMAVQFVEYALGKDIGTELAERGLSLNPNAFSDTTDASILAAYALGITNGTKAPTATAPGLFTPNGQFSRQEAATMLMRVCNLLGMDTVAPPDSDFVDLDTADSWARDGINFVRANGIMGGTSSATPTFSPKDTYTRQESIVTFDRIR